MTGITDKKIEDVIKNAADKLKNEIKPPSWAPFVKTGAHKQRPPVDPDWWATRAAAVLRKIYLLGPVGTNKLSGKYGGRRKRGVLPEKSRKGSRSVMRKILQQLEQNGYIEQTVKGVHKGRVITPKGVKLLIGKNGSGTTKQKPARTDAGPAPIADAGKQSEKMPNQGSNQ